MRERVLKYGGREEGDYRIRAKKIWVQERQEEKNTRFSFLYSYR